MTTHFIIPMALLGGLLILFVVLQGQPPPRDQRPWPTSSTSADLNVHHKGDETTAATTNNRTSHYVEEENEKESKGSKLSLLRRRGWQGDVEVKRALEVLRRADELFTSAGRDYFLADGSLLGYCRHTSGFTPWDDDMDIHTSRENSEWLNSPQGRQRVLDHGLEIWVVPGAPAFHKLYLPGKEIPRAGDNEWGFPFVDVFPYGVDPIHRPLRRVMFHPRIPQGLVVPHQPGHLLDTQFPNWRTECQVGTWNHHRENRDETLNGSCREFADLLGIQLAPPERCPSPSMHGPNTTTTTAV